MPSTITDRLNGLTTSVAVKAPVRVATTAAITLSGLQTIDGVTVVAGDRVLAKDQSNAVSNGIYTAASGAWPRAADFDGTFDAVGGTQISVNEGLSNAHSYWAVSGDGPVVIGTDNVEFVAGLTGAAVGIFDPDGVYPENTVGKKLQQHPHVEDYKSLVSGGDWQAAIPQAIADAFSSGAGAVSFFEDEYQIGSTIVIGDGSTTQFSTLNSLKLIGVGAPFPRLKSGTDPQRATGTRLKWIGSAGQPMIDIRGPIRGIDTFNLALNCNDLATSGLKIRNLQRSAHWYLTVSNFTSIGVDLSTQAMEAIDGITEGLTNSDVWFIQPNIVEGAAGSACMKFDGYLGSASNGWDTTRVFVSNPYFTVDLAGSKGFHFGYCDQVTIYDPIMTGYGVANGSQASVYIEGVRTVPDNYAFPQNIRFLGNVDIGQSLPVKIADSATPPGPGIDLGRCTSLDQQVIIQEPEKRYVRMEYVDASGNWSETGYTVLDRAWRNRFLNGNFHRCTRGTSGSGLTSTHYLADQWVLAFDGTVNFDWSIQELTPGQTDVPFPVRRFLRLTINSASGGSYMYLGQRVLGARQMAGTDATLSAYLKVGTGTKAIAGRLEQQFGTGGSPSTLGSAALTGASIGTTWTLLPMTGVLPSVSGKTFGTNGDDYLAAYFSLPINTTFTLDIAAPQFEQGIGGTAFEIRPNHVDENGCAQFLQLCGAGATGLWMSSTSARVGVQLPTALWTIPTISAAGVSTTIQKDSTGTLSATPTVALVGTATVNGFVADLGNFSGATADKNAVVQTNCILASAEL